MQSNVLLKARVLQGMKCPHQMFDSNIDVVFVYVGVLPKLCKHWGARPLPVECAEK